MLKQELIENQRDLLAKGHNLWVYNSYIKEGHFSPPKDQMIFASWSDRNEEKTLISWRTYNANLFNQCRHIFEELGYLKNSPEENKKRALSEDNTENHKKKMIDSD